MLITPDIDIEAFKKFREFYQKHNNRFYELTGIPSNGLFPMSGIIPNLERAQWWKIHAALKLAIDANPKYRDWGYIVLIGIESDFKDNYPCL